MWEDDVVASPSPAVGKDANTASDKVAAVRFSAAVLFLGRCIQVRIYNSCLPDSRFCLYCYVLANIYGSCDVLLPPNAECRRKILLFIVPWLSIALVPDWLSIFSMINWGTAIERNCSGKQANPNTSHIAIFREVQCSHHLKFRTFNYILNNISTVNR